MNMNEEIHKLNWSVQLRKPVMSRIIPIQKRIEFIFFLPSFQVSSLRKMYALLFSALFTCVYVRVV